MRSFLAITAAGLALVIATPDRGSDAHYVDASLEPEGELLGAAFVDVDGDGRDEVCLALRPPGGSRELHLHRIEPDRIPAEPFAVVPVLDETLAYGFADVREEPGRELVFLTAGGVWSYSLTLDGYRGNVERLVETELLYDVPDPDELLFWRFVLPGPDGDHILLPGPTGFAVWGPVGADGGRRYARAGGFAALEASYSGDGADRRHGPPEREERTEVRLGPGGLALVREKRPLGGLLIADEDDGGTFLDVEREYSAPALCDVDGDGRLDLLALAGEELRVHLADASGAVSAAPSRVEPLPAYLEREERDEMEREVELADLDGDGDPDLVVRIRDADGGLENSEITLYLLLNDGTRLLPDEPSQVLRFEAAELRLHVTDVDGDGRPDLALRKFEMPSFLDAVTGLEFTMTHLLYPGERGSQPFARKPVLKQAQQFDETTLQEAIKNRELALDCDGDGIADLVEIDLRGRIAIRRLSREKSFFGGTRWALEETPWLRFDAFGDVSSIEVRDLNGDGLGDIVSEGEKALTVLLSSRTGGGR